MRDDVALLLDDPLTEVAAQDLAGIDADGVAVLETRASFYGQGNVADPNGPIGLEDLEAADFVIVIAENFEEQFPARARGEKDVVDIEQRGVIRDEIAGFVSFELEAPAERASAAAKIGKEELGIVVKDDAVIKRRLKPGAGA